MEFGRVSAGSGNGLSTDPCYCESGILPETNASGASGSVSMGRLFDTHPNALSRTRWR